jgi:CRISPR system Cascade subunit CasB
MSALSWDVELEHELTAMASPENPDRAALAHLRRGLGAPAAYTLARVGWLFRRVPESYHDSTIDAAVLAAGLFAWAKGNCPQKSGVNFGAAFGANQTPEAKQRREKRFIDLLDADNEDLPYKLRQAITLLAAEGSALDWVMLIDDLRRWNRPERKVQKAWARGFWSMPPEQNVPTDKIPFSE